MKKIKINEEIKAYTIVIGGSILIMAIGIGFNFGYLSFIPPFFNF